ncbi:MAG: efflux transporter outer membrane subunit [Verrucomicrobiota bacterium]
MNPIRSSFIYCLIPFGLVACAITDSRNALPEIPAAWKNAVSFPSASAQRDLSRWWKRFDDPTLNRVITDGLANSPDIASASSRIREARARRDEVNSSLFPFIGGSAGSNSSWLKTRGLSEVSNTRYSADLNASWEVDWFGKNRSSVEAASAQIGAAEESFHSVQASLAAEIATAYTNLRADETRMTVLRSLVKSREQTAQLATWRQQAGETDSLESSQALSSLEQARAGIPALEQAIAQGKNLLSLLCGREPGSLDSALKSSKSDIPHPERSLAIGIPADTIRQRPDVRLAGWQLVAAVANSRSAEAERFPSLNLTGNLGINALSAGKLFNPQTTGAGLVAGITSPIFDAGRIQSNIEALGEAEEQAVQTYRSAVLTGLSEVEDALIACRRSAERLEILEKATRLARESDQLARQRYEAGEIDFLAVLDSQRTLLGLEDSLISSRADRTTSYIRLYQALGGGWSSAS